MQAISNDSGFTIFGKGFCMGMADVVPGVSGGTMALILHIYTRLINAIKSFDLAWLRGCLRLDIKVMRGRPDWAFVIPLLAGITAALFFFTRVVPLPVLIETHPEAVYGLFFGLILGSIFILIPQSGGVSFKRIIALAAGTLAGLYIFNLVPAETPDSAWFIFLSGALAISAMILPGISGSFILLILKKYSYIFNAIGYLEFSILLPFVLGVITGLVLFSRLLSWLLARFYQVTLMVITGLLVASLWVIWPFQQRTYEIVGGEPHLIQSTPVMPASFDMEGFTAVMLAVAGLLVVLILQYLAARNTAKTE